MIRVLFLVVALLALPLDRAQAAGPRIGFLSPTTAQGSQWVLEGLRQGLREHGFIDGVNVTIEARFAEDRFERLPGLARELVALPVDVLVANVTQASLAAKQATDTIPIVMLGVSDPLASRLVASLSRPGSNVTGTSAPFAGAAGKGLQLLKEVKPDVQRLAAIWNPANAVFQSQVLKETQTAARALGLELTLFEARDVTSLDAALETVSRQRLSAVTVLPDPILAANWSRIATRTTAMRLPSVTVSAAYAEAGGLMSYGPSLPEMARLSGRYVARILRGSRPAELPVEQADRFELVINTRTARAIGLEIPRSVLLQANRTID